MLMAGWVWLRLMRAGSKNCERWAAYPATPNSRGKQFSVGESGTLVPLLRSAASAPWCLSHALGILHNKSFPMQRGLVCCYVWCVGSVQL